MRKLNFKGGVYPEYNKEISADKTTKVLSPPEVLVIPLDQHIGAPADPLVKKGDQVELGQVIGQSTNTISAPVHSSVSGKVLAVEPRTNINGRAVLSVVIENDGEDRAVEMSGNSDPIFLSDQDIRDRIEAAGIVGLGGAGFPTIVKMNHPKKDQVDHLIINGSECEPYLTSDQRLMIENPKEIVLGAKLMAKACGAEKIIIAIEENKPESIKSIKMYIEPDEIEVVSLVTKYPAGGEKQLVKAVLGREVPANGLPYQVGVVVQNVGTAAAVAKACLTGMPLIERVVTVSGDGIKEPGNFRVRIGTQVKDLIDAAGGFQGEPGKVIIGGPMMGNAQSDLDVPVTKGVGGVTIFSSKTMKKFDPLPCIKCARCVDVCPVYLMPVQIEKFAMNSMWDDAADYGAMDCIECGCCTYICPSKRGLLHWIRIAKAEIVEARRSQTS